MKYSKFMAGIAVSATEPDNLRNSVELPTYEFIALCMSEVCSKTDYGVQRDVTRAETFCPECGHALFWQRNVQ